MVERVKSFIHYVWECRFFMLKSSSHLKVLKGHKLILPFVALAALDP